MSSNCAKMLFLLILNFLRLIHYVKMTLILLLQNLSHQKMYILTIIIVSDGEGIQSTFSQETVKQLEVIEEVVLLKASKLNRLAMKRKKV